MKPNPCRECPKAEVTVDEITLIASVDENAMPTDWIVVCEECQSCTPPGMDSEFLAVETWNFENPIQETR